MKLHFIPILISVLLFVGCSKHEGCTEFGAENYDPDAIVNDGNCVKVYDKFIGEYMVDSNCSENFYQLKVEKTNDDYVVRIIGLADTLPAINADISGNNISFEQHEIQHHILIEGAGVNIDGGLSISYHTRDSRSGETIIQDCMQWCSKL